MSQNYGRLSACPKSIKLLRGEREKFCIFIIASDSSHVKYALLLLASCFGGMTYEHLQKRRVHYYLPFTIVENVFFFCLFEDDDEAGKVRIIFNVTRSRSSVRRILGNKLMALICLSYFLQSETMWDFVKCLRATEKTEEILRMPCGDKLFRPSVRPA